MKLILEPVHVQFNPADGPTTVIWRGKPYRVCEIHEQWTYNGRWWTTPNLRGRFRRYFRLSAAPPGGAVRQLEIYREAGSWKVSKILD